MAFAWWCSMFWAVLSGNRYILAGGVWLVVLDIFWLVMGSVGWLWVIVGDGWWWHSLF